MRATGGRGEPLPHAQTIQHSFGHHDVAGVRAHRGAAAQEGAAQLGARAFAYGDAVAFASLPDLRTAAHEAAHVVQQRGGRRPAGGIDSPGDALERHADAVADAVVAGRSAQALLDSTVGASATQAVQRDATPAPDLDAAAYRRQFADEIGRDTLAFLAGREFPSGSAYVTLPVPLLIAPALLDTTAADLESRLDGWLGRDKVTTLIDKARVKGRVPVTDDKGKTWVEDKTGSGPGRWYPDVGTELGAALEALLRRSLDRIVPRFISAAVATGMAEEARREKCLIRPPMPKASDVVPSQPIDSSVIKALIAYAIFDYQGYRIANPTEQGSLGQLRPLVTKWETPRNGTYWLRVLSPADPTIEEVANALYGSSLKTEQIVVAAAPLFGLSSASGLLEHHTRLLAALGSDLSSGDAVEEALTGPLADEIAKNQGAHQPSKAKTRNDVLRSIDESLAILPAIENSGAVFGMGKNPTVSSLGPLRKKLVARRAAIAADPSDADALAWAGQVEAQQAILSQVSFGFDLHAKRLADLTKMVTDAAVKFGAFNLPPHVRNAMNHVAMGFADVALLSELPETAAPRQIQVEDEAGQLPITFLEGTLESIQRSLDDARDAKHDAAEHASYGVDAMRARQQELKLRLAELRATIKTDPAGATKAFVEIAKLVDALQQESELVGNMDAIDATWHALNEGVSWFWSSGFTQIRAKELKKEGDNYHARWKEIFTQWQTNDPEAQKGAKARLDILRNDPGFRAWFGKVSSVISDAQTEALIGKIAALLVITVITAGVGDVVAAGAAGWELSAGTTAVLVGGAEAATFTVLNQIFLDDDHSFGHIVYEFGANWAMFSLMRRFQTFAELAQLSKVKAVGGSTLIMAATMFAKADLDKLIQDGRHLNSDEIKKIALQGIAMAIAMHAIAPVAKKAFAELEGSAYAFAARIKANNVAQEALTVQAQGLKGTRDFKVAQDYVAKEKAWLEDRLKILDEIEAQARIEAEGGTPVKDGGIAGKIKMSPADMATLRADIQSNIAALDAGAQPLLHLEPKAPGVYTCTPERIGEVTKALGEVTKVSENPTTFVKTYEVKTSDGSLITVMERVDPSKASWVADLRTGLDATQRATFDAATTGKTPDQIHDSFGGSIEQAKAAASGLDLPRDLAEQRAGLNDVARAEFDARLREKVKDLSRPSQQEIDAFRQSLDAMKANHDGDLAKALESEATPKTTPDPLPPTLTPDPAPPTKAPKPLPEVTEPERKLLHQAADSHAERELAKYKEIPPEADQRVKNVAREAGERAYQERRRDGADAAKARKHASNQAKAAAKPAAEGEARRAAIQTAERALTDGTAFEEARLPADAKTQLDDFRAGKSGQSAKRLAPELEGKTQVQQAAILDAEVAAGNATRVVEKIPDPTDPTQTAEQDQPVYDFADGARIRLKPKGDAFNPGEPMFSIEVKQVLPGGNLPRQEGVAFKVDDLGRPIPKGPFEINNPFSKGGDQIVQWEIYQQHLLSAGHRKSTP